MRAIKLAILGATGAVGREMLRLIEEYQIPVEELRLLSGPGSAGKTIVPAVMRRRSGKAAPYLSTTAPPFDWIRMSR